MADDKAEAVAPRPDRPTLENSGGDPTQGTGRRFYVAWATPSGRAGRWLRPATDAREALVYVRVFEPATADGLLQLWLEVADDVR